jgi:GAF domain-containing protein
MATGHLDEAVLAVSRFLVADRTMSETLTDIAVIAKDALAPAAAVGVTMLEDGKRPVTAVATDGMAPAVDRAQYDEDAGPCIDSYRQVRPVRVDDVTAVSDRWPKFTHVALDEGVLSTYSLPLQAGEEVYGAFNLYARTRQAFTPDDQAAGRLFATQAAVVLANTGAYWAAADLAGGLVQAMESRAVIEQARGKIMASSHCTPDEAFDRLVQASRRTNIRLRELAARIVAEP